MPISVQRNRRKTLQLSVNSAGDIIIKAPLKLPLEQINTFIRQKQSWIVRAQEKQRSRIALPTGAQNFRQQKEAARTLVQTKLEHFNQHYHFSWKRISIRNSSTRWGSCSRQMNLNFNYKIIYLPPTIQDYIIVHELCHLAEMNHSPRFWNCVAKTIPDYKSRRQQLHNYQLR